MLLEVAWHDLDGTAYLIGIVCCLRRDTKDPQRCKENAKRGETDGSKVSR